MLRRIVATAIKLVGARYGALGVLDQEGAGLADFGSGHNPRRPATGRAGQGRCQGAAQ
ncbi:hypothetical protein LKL35_02280 [Streptomyces sp. ET3-23]|uniref:hypothetical protein n=1 Tax=Streptomyces sp. ET3-23 TaxID=2885643 RepID=UPI001D117E5C|nr:hypothetical protein [Streptomyces sp. ET3-23]MCC2274269.1 hypothetical protein [Streptomyces sp. ET3-23]